MNKSSGFRTIEFIEKPCSFMEAYFLGFTKDVKCINGLLWTISGIPVKEVCPKCKGTGKVEIVESKIE